MNRSFRTSCVAAVFALFLAPVPADAGVTYLGQYRRVDALGENRTPIDVEVSDEVGSFDREASVDFAGSGGRRTRARATQTSTLGGTTVRASGTVSARSESDVGVTHSYLEIGFAVSEPTPFMLNAAMDVTATGPGGPPDSLFPLFSAFVAPGELLTRLGPTVAGITVTEPEFRSGTERPEISAEGILQPGRTPEGMVVPGWYVLKFSAAVYANGTVGDGGTFDPAEMQASYTLDFRLGDDAAGPGPGPTPGPGPGPAIPLPPAVWTGLLTLGGMAAARWRTSRRLA